MGLKPCATMIFGGDRNLTKNQLAGELLKTAAADGRMEVIEWIASCVRVEEVLYQTNGLAISAAAENGQMAVLRWFGEIMQRRKSYRNNDQHVLRIIENAAKHTLTRIVANNLVEVWEWFMDQGLVLDNVIGENKWLEKQNLVNNCVTGSVAEEAPEMLQKLLELFPEILQMRCVAYNDDKIYGTELITMAAHRRCHKCLRILLPLVDMQGFQWVHLAHHIARQESDACLAELIACQKFSKTFWAQVIATTSKARLWLAERMFGILRRADYPENVQYIWHLHAAVCIENAEKVLGSANTLPPEIWQYISTFL